MWKLEQIISTNRKKKKNNKGAQISKKRRFKIYFRDFGFCHICKNHVPICCFTLDHIIPKSKGGTSAQINLKVAHKFCNEKRGNKIK